MNQKQIREHYKRIGPSIVSCGRNEWGVDPYAWDMAGITLTPIEQWLWHDIRAVGAVLYPQYPVLGFFADFANPVAKVVIECDGAEFHKDMEKDVRRDASIRKDGWTVYRISGKDCRDGVDSEYPSRSRARQFIQEIALMHGISR